MGYIPVTVLHILDQRPAAAIVTQALRVEESSVYCSTRPDSSEISRAIHGASRASLVGQHLTESVVTALLALVVAMGLVQLYCRSSAN